MAENTLQYEWIVTIKGNLDVVFQDHADVFVAGDLLWYPVEGHPEISQAPDTLVAFGRPQGYRGSYIQHLEGGIAPQVVFEIQSPSNRTGELIRKFRFYERYGVEEYYLYDPDDNELSGWQRNGADLVEISAMNGWVSPRLGVRFEWTKAGMVLYRPDGQRFLSFAEVAKAAEAAVAQLQEASARAQEAIARAQEAERQREQAEQRAALLEAKLRALGADPAAQ